MFDFLPASPAAQLTILAILAVIVVAIGVKLVLSFIDRNPEKRERKRRMRVNQEGRVGDAMVLEVEDDTVYYAYTLRGVRYENSQDIATLREHLPQDLDRLIGQAHIKYSPRNPYNSILVCEEWTGIPAARSASGEPISENRHAAAS